MAGTVNWRNIKDRHGYIIRVQMGEQTLQSFLYGMGVSVPEEAFTYACRQKVHLTKENVFDTGPDVIHVQVKREGYQLRAYRVLCNDQAHTNLLKRMATVLKGH